MTNRGLSLVEVLVALVIGGVIAMGSLQSLQFALQSGAVSKAILTENDFKLTLAETLKEQTCTENLKTVSITNKENTVIPVTGLKLKSDDTDPIIEVGTFKGDIEVVKMEVRANDKADTRRDFVAYYKRTNLGDLNTLAGQDCTASYLGGCYTTQCKLDYEFGQDPDDPSKQIFTGCKSLTCHPVVLQVAGSRFPCKWGELWDGNKCDNREKKGSGTCATPEGAKFLGWGDNATGRTEVDEKCKCNGILTADGLCLKKEDVTSAKIKCWPRNTGQFADTQAVEKFCSKKYQGREFCLESESVRVFAGHFCFQRLSSQDQRYTDKFYKKEYYKRVYNRETGEVFCVKHIRCSYKHGDSAVVKLNSSPPSESWFMPQVQ